MRFPLGSAFSCRRAVLDASLFESRTELAAVSSPDPRRRARLVNGATLKNGVKRRGHLASLTNWLTDAFSLRRATVLVSNVTAANQTSQAEHTAGGGGSPEHFRRRFFCRIAIAGLGLVLSVARANTNVLTARSEEVTNQFEAYAFVAPRWLITLQPLQAGVITGLDVLPGFAVEKGQKLAELSGPEMDAAQAQVQARMTGAEAGLAAAEQALAVAQQQLSSHLSTLQEVANAHSAVAAAQGALDMARAARTTYLLSTTLVAPAQGAVLGVSVGDGQRVQPGQTILTLLPAGGLWLSASFFGSALAEIHPGMTGAFLPAGGGNPIAVKVATLFGVRERDNGERVGLVPLSSEPHWQNGQFGIVRLNGEVRSLVTVPTRALILAKGKWWLLVRTPQGERPQEVTPGPTRGWQTFIERGLKPGTRIEVENAYLEFHRHISSAYQPPD